MKRKRRDTVPNIIKRQDPNEIYAFENYGCRTVNDYKEWSSLSSEVKVSKMTKQEMDLYLKNKG